jgi:hypothetical protein
LVALDITSAVTRPANHDGHAISPEWARSMIRRGRRVDGAVVGERLAPVMITAQPQLQHFVDRNERRRLSDPAAGGVLRGKLGAADLGLDPIAVRMNDYWSARPVIGSVVTAMQRDLQAELATAGVEFLPVKIR